MARSGLVRHKPFLARAALAIGRGRSAMSLERFGGQVASGLTLVSDQGR